MKALLTVILVVATIVYVSVGGGIIHVIESHHEANLRKEISHHLEQSLLDFLCTICT